MKYAFNFDLCEIKKREKERRAKHKKNTFSSIFLLCVFFCCFFLHSVFVFFFFYFVFLLAKRKSFIFAEKSPYTMRENVMPIFCIYQNIVIMLQRCNQISFLLSFCLTGLPSRPLRIPLLSGIHNLPHSITHSFIRSLIHSFTLVRPSIHT